MLDHGSIGDGRNGGGGRGREGKGRKERKSRRRSVEKGKGELSRARGGKKRVWAF